MDRITKTHVTEMLKSLPNYKCYTFNSNKKVPTGSIGFSDHVLLSEYFGIVVFIEVKLYKDVLSPKQIELQNILEGISKKTSRILYFQITEKNLHEIIGIIANGGRGWLADE